MQSGPREDLFAFIEGVSKYISESNRFTQIIPWSMIANCNMLMNAVSNNIMYVSIIHFFFDFILFAIEPTL